MDNQDLIKTLLETYTAEQLAEKVINLSVLCLQNEAFTSLQSRIKSPLGESIEDNYKMQIKQREAKISKLEKEYEKIENIKDNALEEAQKLKRENQRKGKIISQMNEDLSEIFEVTLNVENNPDEFKEILKGKAKRSIEDFLPEEPIKVADMLINAEGKYEHNPLAKALYKEDKGTYRIFDISELRQIAEHLLVYCGDITRERNERLGDKTCQ